MEKFWITIVLRIRSVSKSKPTICGTDCRLADVCRLNLIVRLKHVKYLPGVPRSLRKKSNNFENEQLKIDFSYQIKRKSHLKQ